MSNPSKEQIEAAAMAGRAMWMRLAGLVSEKATVGYCWHATADFLKDECREAARFMLIATSTKPDDIKDWPIPDISERKE